MCHCTDYKGQSEDRMAVFFFLLRASFSAPTMPSSGPQKHVPALWEALLTSQPFPFPEPRSDPVATWHFAENTLGVQVSFPGHSLSTPQGGGCSLRTRPAFSVSSRHSPLPPLGNKGRGPGTVGTGQWQEMRQGLPAARAPTGLTAPLPPHGYPWRCSGT